MHAALFPAAELTKQRETFYCLMLCLHVRILKSEPLPKNNNKKENHADDLHNCAAILCLSTTTNTCLREHQVIYVAVSTSSAKKQHACCQCVCVLNDTLTDKCEPVDGANF